MFALLMGLKTISPDEVLRLTRGAGHFSIFDVNSSQSFAKAHVPGAKRIHPAAYSEGDLPPDKGDTLVFYCANPMCRKAPNAARRAKKLGYEDVRVMSAGISGWLSANLPTEAA